jgi:hypothetical protein
MAAVEALGPLRIGVGTQLAGIQSAWLGYALLGIAAAWTVLVIATSQEWVTFHAPVRRRGHAAAIPTAAALTLYDKLSSAIGDGEALLREARQPETCATEWQVDNFMRRGTEWFESVSKVLAAHGERERLSDWTGVSIWTRGRPRAHEADEVRTSLADPLWERLEMLERYAREVAP